MWPWKKEKPQSSWVCGVCGKTHEGAISDYAWKLPDDVWAAGEEHRTQMLEWSEDMSFVDRRWFVRGMLEVPYKFGPGRWGWGLWAEVDESVLKRYSEIWELDGSNEPRVSGKIACKISLFPDSVGLPVEIQFGPPDLRPSFFLPADSTHPLALEQRNGIDEQRYHEIVAAVTGKS
jgi:hypothetical protein